MLKTIITAAISAALVLFLSQSYITSKNTANAEGHLAFDRVMSTHTLRCGYILWPPEFSKDVTTGQFSGINYDIINELGKRLNLKIEWTEEVSFTTMSEGLKNHRYDAICFSLYRDSLRAPWAEMSTPLFFSGHGVFIRKDDSRFSVNDLSSFNNPEITIGTIDGEMSSIIAQKDFPKAKTVSLPQTSSPAEVLMTVTSKKADVTFVNVNSVALFDKTNPGLIKNLSTSRPVVFFSHGFAYNKGETKLKNTIDIVLDEMQNQGITQAILKQHEIVEGGYLTVAPPYAPLP